MPERLRAGFQRDAFTRETRDLCFALAVPAVMAVYCYGIRALGILACGIGSALLFEGLATVFYKRKEPVRFLSSGLVGALLALMLPSTAPLWMAAAGTAFAVLVVQMPFGGGRYAPVAPPAAAFAFLCICWPDRIFHFAAKMPRISELPGVAFVSSESLASMLKAGKSVGRNPLTFLNLWIGNVSSALGTGCMAVLLMVALFFLFRRVRRWIPSASFVTVCLLAAVLFPRVDTGRRASLMMELAAGSMVFAALFVLPWFSCCPKDPVRALLFGAAAGVVCVLLNRFGVYEDNACFAVLVMNIFWPLCEDIAESLHRQPIFSRKKEAVHHG